MAAVWVSCAVFAVLALFFWHTRRQERRELSELLEELSGRPILGFSPGGRLVALGERARQVLGLAGRVDPIRTEDLPLEGLARLLHESGDEARSSRTGALVLHGTGCSDPVRAEIRALCGRVRYLAFDPPDLARATENEEPRARRASRDAGGRPARAGRGRLAGVRLLLAEDSPDNQLLLTYLMQAEGAELVLVENGRDAVERALAERFDLVLLDLQMPVMEGWEAAREIRRHAPDLPLVALSASTSEEDRSRCLEAGCQAFLDRPIKRATLIETVARLVEAVPRSSGEDEVDLLADPQFREVLDEFMTGLDARIEAMRSALERGAWEELRTLAHQLKGAAGCFGLPDVSVASAELEKCAGQDPEAAMEALRLLGARITAAERPPRPAGLTS